MHLKKDVDTKSDECHYCSLNGKENSKIPCVARRDKTKQKNGIDNNEPKDCRVVTDSSDKTRDKKKPKNGNSRTEHVDEPNISLRSNEGKEARV